VQFEEKVEEEELHLTMNWKQHCDEEEVQEETLDFGCSSKVEL